LSIMPRFIANGATINIWTISKRMITSSTMTTGHISALFDDFYSYQTNADVPLFQQIFLKSVNLWPATSIQPVC
jgi:hypothetical protein